MPKSEAKIQHGSDTPDLSGQSFGSGQRGILRVSQAGSLTLDESIDFAPLKKIENPGPVISFLFDDGGTLALGATFLALAEAFSRTGKPDFLATFSELVAAFRHNQGSSIDLQAALDMAVSLRLCDCDEEGLRAFDPVYSLTEAGQILARLGQRGSQPAALLGRY